MTSEKKYFTFSEIHDGVISGDIKIETKKHNLLTFGNAKKTKEYFKEEIIKGLSERAVLFSDISLKLKKEGKEKESLFFTSVQIGARIDGVNAHCWDCCSGGTGLYSVLTDAKTITLMTASDYWKMTKSNLEYILGPKDIIKNCEVAELKIKDKLVSEIDVPSGNLIFTNFFKDKLLYEKQGKEYHTINSILGRIELMNDLASRNVGYAQMGNMSVDVFLKKDGKEIIIGTNFGYDKEGGEFEIEFKGFKHLGNISLSVWRWMCADKQVLDEHKEEIPKDLKSNSGSTEDYKDYIWAKVKPGRWVIEHYYDIVGDRKDGIYSKLYLK